ncbi:alpha/beta fold hydrolase [uncultured Jatrophihabitans sp.]|uniref:alpha/beta fold hydrolase n=1 Tax=uncultured Jatrophihabitans sp. TaxID=1610747 RepID=UPI0035CA1FD5
MRALRPIDDAPRPEHAATLDGVHYVVTGEADAPGGTLVLLHGFCDNLTTWNRVVPALAAEHRVIAIDLPGFGRSARPAPRPLLAGYAEVVAAVLDAEGVREPVALIGNSMGAATAMTFATRHPDRVDALVLIDMPGLRGVPRLWRVAMSRPAELGLRTALRAVPDAAAQFGISWAYGRIAAARPAALDPSVRQGFGLPYAVRGSVAAIVPIGRRLVRELPGADLARHVAQSPVPVLLVFGARDLLTPARVLRRIGRPGGAVVLPGCGHCPQVDQPSALLGEVGPFLRAARSDVDRTARSA